jgi:hypothetical protein
MPKIGRNTPCPCGQEKKFKNCHGKTDQAFAELKEGMHEIGHSAMLPQSAQPHVSFSDPCPLCVEGESRTQVRQIGQTTGVSIGAHSSYAGEFDPLLPEFILHSVLGGAAEVACGLEPTMTTFEDLGQFPESMGFDFDDLRAELTHRGLWEQSRKYIKPCFELAVRDLRQHLPEFRRLALQLIEKRTLVGDDLAFTSFRREKLIIDAAELMGPEVKQAAQKKFSNPEKQKDTERQRTKDQSKH